MSDEFSTSSRSQSSQSSWFTSPQAQQRPSLTETNTSQDDSSSSPNETPMSKFMQKFGRKSGVKNTGNLQLEWSKRNQMNLSLGVSSRHLDDHLEDD